MYLGANDELFVGVVGTPGQFFLEFTTAGTVANYLPSTGPASTLTASLLNPATTPSGTFGGDVVALELNVAFSNAGFLHGTSKVPFGDLVLTNFSGGLSPFNALTVSEFLAIAETCLGDGSCPYGVGNVDAVAANLAFSFPGGTVSTFADSNLALPSSATPEPSSLLLFGTSLLGLVPFRRKLFGR